MCFSLWLSAKGPDSPQVGFKTLVLAFGGCQARVKTDCPAAQREGHPIMWTVITLRSRVHVLTVSHWNVLRLVLHFCDPSTQEKQAIQTVLSYSEFKGNLGYMGPIHQVEMVSSIFLLDIQK